ncbi:hypothetical protein [Acuticoccus kandeliae]|uniref:hypothetical protein n=1 Tax=Acuticoccus kandeliae TaxID=2073160 RepID=UPI00196A6C00|nr:hypothetical protein [Acuticoccus kandeliae]
MRFFLILAALLVAANGYAAGFPPLDAPRAADAAGPTLWIEIHDCHTNPFFDAEGRLHRHDSSTCEVKPIEPLLGADICSTVAQMCETYCEPNEKPFRCLRRCYRRNAPPVC